MTDCRKTPSLRFPFNLFSEINIKSYAQIPGSAQKYFLPTYSVSVTYEILTVKILSFEISTANVEYHLHRRKNII